MRKVYCLLTLTLGISGIALADSWSGKLIDAACYEKQQSAAGCDATGTTRAFALDASGKVFKLDAKGNEKAAAALKNRADQSADPSKPASATVMAKVDGSESAGTIAVESIQVQ